MNRKPLLSVIVLAGIIFFRGTSFAADAALNVKPSGNVGIGTTAPAAKLDVNGNIHATGDICTDANGRCLSTAGTGGGGSVWNLNANGDINYSSGNVGIGTSVPQRQFEIKGGAVDTGIRLGVTSAAKMDIYREYATGYYFFDIQESGAAMKFQLNPASNGGFHFLNGNVGIGTMNPGVPLEVSKGSNTPVTLLKLTNTSGTGNIGHIDFAWGATPTTVARINSGYQSTNGGYLAFTTAHDSTGTLTERMRIDNSGNVGIGTTSPVYKLHVQEARNNWAAMIANARGSGYGLYVQSEDGSGSVMNFATLNNLSSYTFYIKDNGNYYFRGANESTKESKRNIKKFKESGIELLKDIEIVTYNYKADDLKRIERIGFIANDENNSYDKRLTNNNTAFDTNSIVATLIKAVQEQQKEIKELKMAIETLQKENKK